MRHLYYRWDGSIEEALHNFRSEAKAASLHWLPKPRPNSSYLHGSAVPPRAKTAGQRWTLQNILLESLDGCTPSSHLAAHTSFENSPNQTSPPRTSSPISTLPASLPPSSPLHTSFNLPLQPSLHTTLDPSRPSPLHPSLLHHASSSTQPASRSLPSRARSASPQLIHPIITSPTEELDQAMDHTPKRPIAGRNTGLTSRVERFGIPSETSPPSVGSKRPSLDGSVNSPSKRVKGKQPILTTPTKPPPAFNVFDKVPSRQRLAPDAIDGADTSAQEATATDAKASFGTTLVNTSRSSFIKTSYTTTNYSKSPFLNKPTPAPFLNKPSPAVKPTTVNSPAQNQQPVARPSAATRKTSAQSLTSFASATSADCQDKGVPTTSRPGSKTNSSTGNSVVSFHSAKDRYSSNASTTDARRVGPTPIPFIPPPVPQFKAAPAEVAIPGVLGERLKNIWPIFPQWLQRAPLAVAWEVTRIGLHCQVDLNTIVINYEPSWNKGVEEIWKAFRKYNQTSNKQLFQSFPEKPSAEAWMAAMSTFETKGNVVVLQATLDWNEARTGPLFHVNLRPLHLDQGCRLTRRFGGDRFFEILLPSPTSSVAPPIISKHDGAPEQVISWLTQQQHSLAGRKWRAFYTKDAGYRKPLREFRLGPEPPKAVFKDRVHFFAECGNGFQFAPRRVPGQKFVVPVDESIHTRTEFKVSQMLDWLLNIEENGWQPHLKLFSRIQLGLSKTFPVLTFEPEQIYHHENDILSPANKVMNDGIGRMSRSVARKIRDALGLSDIPSAVQARIGSAKGMWLLDVQDTSDDDWIETYPSQRKWVCDPEDPMMRTLEIRSISSELKSAGLNLQLLPVLEDRAQDKAAMRRAIGMRLTNDLQKQFDGQKEAFNSPLQFRDWLTSNFNSRAARVASGHVPSLGGLPQSKEEIMHLMLNSGFDPRKQKYIQDIAWDLQRQKCEILKTKLNIKVGRSAYVYMVVDFLGVLKEGEIHLGFSNKFRAESEDLSFTLLADCDVLVARSPAHFTSDVQKVRAVFKSELHALKDVIVFPARGDIPLADMLSGGDYDGDMAWVCWDPEIVNGFQNAPVPEQPDLSRYMIKDKTTFGDLVVHGPGPNDSRAKERAVYDMITKSFKFAMQPNFLGICTNYKERLCYRNNDVGNYQAVVLSTLVGSLVDQSKQGITFTTKSWELLRRELLGGNMNPPDPAYKGDTYDPRLPRPPAHIIDYLKFHVAKPAIDRELAAFHKKMGGGGDINIPANPDDPNVAHFYDRDLVLLHDSFAAQAAKSKTTKAMLDALGRKINELRTEWSRSMAVKKGGRSGEDEYSTKVARLYQKWQAITIASLGVKVDPKVEALLEQDYLASPAENSYFALLKASTGFKHTYRNAKFIFQMAGRQLAFMKAMVTKGGVSGGPSDGALVLVTPLMYAGLAPDQKFTRQYLARVNCDGSQYPDQEDADAEGGNDGERGWGFGGYDDY
ncbi:RNA-dependent RNA polymerase [Echria macrotheca]|uniref:RNA-dependent RNA polymerase n=1 Tax=Echria macrotheca TaxID=438768 RepID=A0AAJ0FCH9_9PEZI|nr:RNA-dependent RNA polymerase [Echria macrotheca]